MELFAILAVLISLLGLLAIAFGTVLWQTLKAAKTSSGFALGEPLLLAAGALANRWLEA